jgi:prevent-host-death family protein
MKEETIGAAEFKARCLALLDRVSKTGRPLTITKRGKAVARLSPARPPKLRPLKGSVLEQGDLVASIEADWEASR